MPLDPPIQLEPCRGVLLHHGDVADVLPTLAPCDAVLCDPPYGLGFMGKDWDSPGGTGDFPSRRTTAANTVNTGASRQGGRQRGCSDWQRRQARDARAFQRWSKRWAEVLPIKPGGHLLAFGGTRMYHRLTAGIEDAGYEVRDCLMWLYGSGFPKSHNFGRQLGDGWAGHGTALKPAWEPIVVAMRPLDGTYLQNAQKHGMAGINVDGCRVGTSGARNNGRKKDSDIYGDFGPSERVDYGMGRWPANVILDEAAGAMLDQQSGDAGAQGKVTVRNADKFRNSYGAFKGDNEDAPFYADAGGASRFFYCAKASRAERNAGLDGLPAKPLNWSAGTQNPGSFQAEGTDRTAKNHHPTVKPLALTEYLARLILPPKRDTPRRLLVPFCGSGSEIIGALRAGWDEVIGIDAEAEYLDIASRRIAHAAEQIERERGLFGGAA